MIFIVFSLFIIPVYKKLRAENQKQELRVQFRDFLYSRLDIRQYRGEVWMRHWRIPASR